MISFSDSFYNGFGHLEGHFFHTYNEILARHPFFTQIPTEILTFLCQAGRSKIMIFDNLQKLITFQLKSITNLTLGSQIGPDPILTYVFLMVDDHFFMEIIMYF